MNDEKKQQSTAGSDGSLHAGSNGASRTEPQKGKTVTGGCDAGRGSGEPAGERRQMPEEPVSRPVRSVFRKTELHGTPRIRTPEVKNQRRKTIIEESGKPGTGTIPPQAMAAFRDILDTIIGKQDRLYEEMLLNVADLQQQIDALECNALADNRPLAGEGEVIS
jgi:hypothetical protein